MGWTSYNKFGEVVFSADTLDGYDSTDFVFKSGDVMLGNLGVELIGGNIYVENPATNAQGRITENALEFGNAGYDWSLQRTAANIAQLGANDKIRDTSDPVNNNDLSRKAYIDNLVTTTAEASMPTGTLLDFAGSSAPTGFLVCDGSEILRASYPDLDAVIGTTFGPYTDGAGGAGTSHMRLPDFRGRTAVGAGTGAGDGSSGAAGSVPAGAALSARTRGAWGGGETHILTPAQTPLRTHSHSGTTGNDNIDHSHSGSTSGISANHTHSGSTGGASSNHTHNVTHTSISNTEIGGIGQRVTQLDGGTVNHTTSGHSVDHGHSFSTGFVSSDHGHSFTTGGRSAFHQHAFTTGNPSLAEANGSAHNNVQPFLVVNKIIKT